jgi:multidrug resistance efflux pump
MQINRKKLRRVMYVFFALLGAAVFASKTFYNLTLPRVDVALTDSGRLSKYIEARGVLYHAVTQDVYSAIGGLIEAVYVTENDLVTADTILLDLIKEDKAEEEEQPPDYTMDRLNNRMALLELNRTAARSQLDELDESDGLQNFNRAVADAIKTVEGRREELLKAQTESGFDDYEYQQRIDDAEKALDDAQAKLAEAEAGEETEQEPFDDYSYRLVIDEAKLTLTRAEEELSKAEAAVTEAGKPGKPFDDYEWRKIIEDAERVYEQAHEDYNKSFDLYGSAYSIEDYIKIQAQIDAAKRKMDDAKSEADKLRADMNKAKKDYDAAAKEVTDKAVHEAELLAERAQTTVDDARRAYGNAVEALERAKDAHQRANENKVREANENADVATQAAREAVDAARLAYDRAVEERSRAYDAAGEAASEKVDAARLNLTAAEAELSRAEELLEEAQANQSEQVRQRRESLEQDLLRIELEYEALRIDMLEASYKPPVKPPKEIPDKIPAGYDGTLISIDKVKGQYVSPGEKVATLSMTDTRFKCEITCPAFDGRFIEMGDEARLSGGGLPEKLKGVVSELKVTGETLTITVSCESNLPQGGEYVTVLIEKLSEDYDVIVPVEAVHPDGFGHFVWMLRERYGSFGIEYYTAKVKVIVADTDDQYAAISRGLEYYYEAPVVTSYDIEPKINGRVLRME